MFYLLIWSVKIKIERDTAHPAGYSDIGRVNNRENFFFSHNVRQY